jgi:hypothetical protein
MSPADFLRAECGNVQDTLDETLRHDYGFGNRHEYYAGLARGSTELC